MTALLHYALVLDPPRAAWCQQVFDSDVLPVLTDRPVTLVRGQQTLTVFWIDLARIRSEIRVRVAARFAVGLGVSREEVDRQISQQGLPILAEALAVVSLQDPRGPLGGGPFAVAQEREIAGAVRTVVQEIMDEAVRQGEQSWREANREEHRNGHGH
jgi:hypothetical protein